MRQAISITILIALFFGFTQAQAQSKSKTSEDSDTDIYIIGGLAHATGSNSFQIGGGIDHYVYKGLSLGGELSEAFGGGVGASVTILSPTVSYHFPVDKEGHFDPFATTGYSHFFIGNGNPDINTGNIGGGLNYWVTNKVGLRFVIDEHIAGSGSIFGLRGGIVFNP